MTSLGRLPKGARGTVAGLPQPHVLAKRLCALGLTLGSEVRVLQNRGSGPLIVEVHGARLALGRGQADRVAVEELDQAPPAESAAPAEPAEADGCAVDVAAER